MASLDPTIPEDIQIIRDLMGAAGDAFDDDELLNRTLATLTWGRMLAKYPLIATEVDSDRIETIRMAQAGLLAGRAAETDTAGGTMRLGDMTLGVGATAGMASGWLRDAWALLASLYPAQAKGTFGGFTVSHGRRGGGGGTAMEAADRPRGFPW